MPKGDGFGAGLGGQGEDDYTYTNQEHSAGYEDELSAEDLIATHSALTMGNVNAEVTAEQLIEAHKAEHGDAYGTGGARSPDLQLHRFASMEPRQMHLAHEWLTGNYVHQSKRGEQIGEALEEFRSVTGVSDAEMAQRFKSELRRTGYFDYTGEVPKDATYTAPSGSQDTNIVLSMMGRTAKNYEEAGAGGRLLGNVDGQNVGESAEGLISATSFVREFAAKLIDPRVAVGGVKYGSIMGDLETAIINQMVTSTGYRGQSSTVPLPNELPIDGLIPTIGNDRNPQGTPFTNLGYDVALQQGQLDAMGDLAFLKKANYAATYFPIDGTKKGMGEEAWEKRKDIASGDFTEFSEMYYDVAQVFKAQFVDAGDEIYGNAKTSQAWRAQSQEYDAQAVVRERISFLGLAWDDSADTQGIAPETPYDILHTGNKLPTDFKDKTFAPAGQRVTGSQNMNYGHNVGLSSSADFEQRVVDLMYPEGVLGLDTKTAMNMDDAIELVYQGEEELDRNLTGLVTDRDIYLSGSRDRNIQGSQAWKAERKGTVSASMASLLSSKDGIAKMATNLARQGFNYVPQYGADGGFQEFGFTGTDASAKGNRREKATKEAFLATVGSNLNYEEAFFETNKDLPGLGASPDGRLFNPDGSSAGLLELKTLQDSTYKGSTKKYYDQMQLQMAVTGEKQVHFFARNQYGEAGDYEYNVVEYDAERAEELIEMANTAQEISGGITTRKEMNQLQSIIQANKSKRRSSSQPAVEGTTFDDKQVDETGEEVAAFKATPAESSKGKSEGKTILDKMLSSKTTDASQPDQEELSLKKIEASLKETQQKQKGTVGISASGKSHDDPLNASTGALADMLRKEEQQELAKAAKGGGDGKGVEANENLAESSFHAAKMINHFAAVAQKAASILKGIGGGLTGATEDVLDEGRLAARVGMTAEELRGTRVTLREAQLTDKQINEVVSGAGELVSTLDTDLGVAGFVESTIVPLHALKAKHPELTDMPIGDVTDWQGLDNQGVQAKVQGMMRGLTPALRKAVGDRLPAGIRELAFAADVTTGEKLNGAIDSEIDIAGGRRVAGGAYEVQRLAQVVNERAATTTRAAGILGETATTIGDNFSVEGLVSFGTKLLAIGGEEAAIGAAKYVGGGDIHQVANPDRIEALKPSQAIMQTSKGSTNFDKYDSHKTSLPSAGIGPIQSGAESKEDAKINNVQNFEVKVTLGEKDEVEIIEDGETKLMTTGD